ncbi:hypothetical protein [Herbidospora sp. NBRC 101105]|uniref:hypothetical protein n=1 Tax=Herbidospora sp. NBRC 101105 TaxID=3032195 RepID=UPI0024A395CC|nr:hypothetical protein [Herbidospora sp. NBRC 101105]GLX96444.1 hypothetical protein Hesp01_43940 [Herbidospora sp. NBRC 101105]
MLYVNMTGWTAFFSGTAKLIGRARPVEGWDTETGVAYVVDPEQGRLRPVTDWEDFSHLERAEQFMAALPGGGWELDDEDDGPGAVVAWLISSSGGATPVTVDLMGFVFFNDMSLADRVTPPARPSQGSR